MPDSVDKERNFLEEVIRLKDNISTLSKELETLKKEKELIEKYYDIFDGIGILETLTKEKEVIGHYYDLFDNIGVSLGEFDIEALREENKRLKGNNVQIDEYFSDEKNLLHHESLIKLKRINIDMLNLFEAENEESFKKNINKMLSKQSLNGIRKRETVFFNDETYYEGENIYQTLKGNQIHVIEKIYFPSEVTNVAVVSFTDITKRKTLENELKFSEQKYRFLFEHVPVMILEYDLSEIKKYFLSLNLRSTEEFKRILMDRTTGVLEETFNRLKIKDVNNTIVKLLNAPNKKDIIDNFGKYYTHRTFNDFIENVIYVFDGKTEWHFETEFITGDGKMLDALVTWQVVTGHEETHSKIYIIIVDITKEKKLESLKETLKDIL